VSASESPLPTSRILPQAGSRRACSAAAGCGVLGPLVKTEGCSLVSGGRIIRLCSSWPSDDPATPLRSSVDTGARNRGGSPAEFAVVAGTLGCREDVCAEVLRSGESNLRTTESQISHLSVKSHLGIAPDPSFLIRNPGVGTPASPKMVTYPEGLVGPQHPAVLDAHPVVSAQSQLRTSERGARP
jgi:hypothetical protein